MRQDEGRGQIYRLKSLHCGKNLTCHDCGCVYCGEACLKKHAEVDHGRRGNPKRYECETRYEIENGRFLTIYKNKVRPKLKHDKGVAEYFQGILVGRNRMKLYLC